MALKLKRWDTAEHLKTEDDIARYWEACLEDGGDDAALDCTPGTGGKYLGVESPGRCP